MTPGKGDSRPRPLAVASSALAFVSLALALYLARYDWNPAVLIAMPWHWAECLGDVPPEIPVFKPGGSDGGYNYAAARDPFLRRSYPECATQALGFAMERWLYHVLSWGLALGRTSLLPYTMPLVNLASVFVIAWVAASVLSRRGLNPWLSLIGTLNPGIWQPLRFNLVDLVFGGSLLAAFWAYERKKPWLCSGLLGVAAFGRGVAILAAGILALTARYEKRKWTESALYLVSYLPYYALFKPWLRGRIELPLLPFGAADRLTWPFEAPLTQASTLLAEGQLLMPLLAAVAAVYLGAAMAAAAWKMWKERRLRYEALIVISFCGAISLLQGAAWQTGPIQIFRVVLFVFPCLVALLADDQRWPARALIAGLPIISAGGLVWMLLGPRMH